MPKSKVKDLTNEYLQRVVDVFDRTEIKREAADSLGIHYTTMYAYIREAKNRGITSSPVEAMADNDPSAIKLKVHNELKRGTRSLDELIQHSGASVSDVLDIVDDLRSDGVQVARSGASFWIDKSPQLAYVKGDERVFRAREDGTFLFGVAGDKHVGSKYHREDVLEDLYGRFAEAGVDAIFDTGNWIDGDARFNAHDVVTRGLDNQCRLLAETHPRIPGVTTFAIWGDDHEGWYAGREGIDVGKYNERIMREHGHDWVDLGFMEAHVILETHDGAHRTKMSVIHPGGGSSYATSYAIQKIVESYEGGEKPAVGLYGHYHKLEAQNVRNVWTLQTGCVEDQTPFMRKKRLEAHVGGTILTLEQDQETGAIIGFSPDMKRYFNRDFHSGRWSRHGPIFRSDRTINVNSVKRALA